MQRLFSILILILSLVCGIQAQTGPDPTDDLRRSYIKDFVAAYKAAYEKEQIEYIKIFFSNKALVITETKELLPTGPELIPMTTKKRPYKSLVEDRTTYIDRLSEIFDSNRKITLGISSVNISRHRRYPEIYGVAFQQIWLDQDGGDNLEDDMPGFVFLLIDFKNSEVRPTIHVRTWQPRDNISKPSDKYGLYDFRVYDLHK